METVWYAGPSGGEDVPNPSAEWMREVMRRDYDEHWGPYSPVGVLARHEHRAQKKLTRTGLGTQTQQSQLLFVRDPKRGWYFEYSTSNQPKDRWLVPLDPDGDREKWVKHWAYGEQLYFLAACFVPPEVAEQIVTDYLADGQPSRVVRWVNFERWYPRKDSESYREWRQKAKSGKRPRG
jgi:hypothetical protein